MLDCSMCGRDLINDPCYACKEFKSKCDAEAKRKSNERAMGSFKWFVHNNPPPENISRELAARIVSDTEHFDLPFELHEEAIEYLMNYKSKP